MKIAHLADIHIQDRRRAEYALVFEKLYESLKSECPDIIALVGDVFDNKMRASPNNMEDVLNFLTNLTKIAPVVMIAGNHDLNCLTPGSLDLLTPLITEHKALQPPNLTYWRNSGVYFEHNIIWTVIATDGQRPSLEEEMKLKHEDAPRICLFHEEVYGAKLPNHQSLTIGKLNADSFDISYDLALGGHIHLRQRFAPRAAYCGSLVQQNIGEPHHGHGYVIWEFELDPLSFPYHTSMPTMRGIDISNNHGFVRIEIDKDGQDITRLPVPTSPLYWEVLCEDITNTTKIIEQYKMIFKMQPRAIRSSKTNMSSASNIENITTLEAAQVASSTITAHADIIKELLAETPELIDRVVALHESKWINTDTTVGGKFRVLKMKFDNMYAFGPVNSIDFTAMEGCIAGVIAPNHTGKSSLVETLLFALYDDHPRAPNKRDVIHRGAKSCHITLEFELDGKIGKIEKGLHTSQTASGGSQYRFEYNGENRTKGGTAETIKEIESVIGSADSALASSFQLQGGEVGGFISLGTAGRKKLLSNVMSLGNFEHIEKSIVKELTNINAKVKLLTSQSRGELNVTPYHLEELTDEYIILEDDLKELQMQLEEHRNASIASMEFYPDSHRQLVGWQNILKNVNTSQTESYNVVNKSFEGFIIPNRAAIIQRLNEANEALKAISGGVMSQTNTTEEEVAEAKAELIKLIGTKGQCIDDIKSITECMPTRSGPRPTSDEIIKARRNADIVVTDDDIKKSTKNLLDAQAWASAAVHLDTIKSKMSLCDRCSSNWITTINGGNGDAELKEAVDAHNNIVKQVKLRNNARSIIERENYWFTKDLEDAMRKYTTLSANLDANILYRLNMQLIKAKQDLVDCDKAIDIAYSATEWWQNAASNAEAAKKAEEAKQQFNETAKQIKVKQQDILQLGKKIAKLESELEFESMRIEQLNEASESQKVLKAYRSVLKPNGGIGDKLLEQARTTLENKINDGLFELGAKYKISITTDYDILILNEAGNLPASLGSGYQKFVLSLATRLAIWRLSVKSRPDAFIIDEGFGVCDDEYLESMAVALEALSSAPDGPKLVFVVSHVDSLKTRLERVLEITVSKTGSRIFNTEEQPIIDVDKPAVEESVIIPDPEHAGKVWCLACKQSLSSARATQHLNSAKHAKNVK